MLSKKSRNRRSGAIGYAEYLKEYYEELERGARPCPSHAELRLFMKQLTRAVDQVYADVDVYEEPIKLRA